MKWLKHQSTYGLGNKPSKLAIYKARLKVEKKMKKDPNKRFYITSVRQGSKRYPKSGWVFLFKNSKIPSK